MATRMLHRASLVSLSCGVMWSAACSFIEFERGPYAIRELDVVYSSQEDVTFLSWRLRDDARLPSVSFELWVDGEWRPLDLDGTLFPAAPYECFSDFWCFQYQIDGRYTVPDDLVSPVRSVHDRDGVFMGPAERQRTVEHTFDVDPIAISRNEEIDPRRFDWFALNDVPLRRSYEWQFRTWDGDACADATSTYRPMSDPTPVDYDWTARAATNGGICFAARPDRRGGGGTERSARLVPSAETTHETQVYRPPRQFAPIVWGVLFDLEIPNPDRCAQVKDQLVQRIESALRLRGPHERLAIYAPVDPETGGELSGCQQHPTRGYPFEAMLRDAGDAVAAHSPTELRVLWVFVNNVELPPPMEVLDQLAYLGLFQYRDVEEDGIGWLPGSDPSDFEEFLPGDGFDIDSLPHLYTWAIGSNVFMNVAPWNVTTGWRPIEDRTLTADIQAVVKATVPFTTMVHFDATEVPIQPPDGVSTRPHQFKTCDATPFPLNALGNESGAPAYGPRDVVPWPMTDDTPPYYLVSLPEQFLVPFESYTARSLDVVVEVCTAFCDGPFRTRGGEDFSSWSATSACQWSL